MLPNAQLLFGPLSSSPFQSVNAAQRTILSIACRQLAHKAVKLGALEESTFSSVRLASLRREALALKLQLEQLNGTRPGETPPPPPLVLCDADRSLLRPSMVELLGALLLASPAAGAAFVNSSVNSFVASAASAASATAATAAAAGSTEACGPDGCPLPDEAASHESAQDGASDDATHASAQQGASDVALFTEAALAGAEVIGAYLSHALP